MKVGLRVSGVTKRYGKVTALAGVSFDAGCDWRCLGVVGRNAAGKTTLLRILTDLLEKDSGTVDFRFDGVSRPFADPREAYFIGESSLLPESLNGRDFCDYLAALNATLGVANDLETRGELIDQLSLADQLPKRISEMSKGTKRKIELVAALSTEVPLVVADELNEGLDIPSMNELQRLVRGANERGQRFLVSSHDVAFLSGIADQVVVIDGGRCADQFEVGGMSTDAAQARILDAFSRDGATAGG